jgi:hypothetical protein
MMMMVVSLRVIVVVVSPSYSRPSTMAKRRMAEQAAAGRQLWHAHGVRCGARNIPQEHKENLIKCVPLCIPGCSYIY